MWNNSSWTLLYLSVADNCLQTQVFILSITNVKVGYVLCWSTVTNLPQAERGLHASVAAHILDKAL